jgi:hypothetical protein
VSLALKIERQTDILRDRNLAEILQADDEADAAPRRVDKSTHLSSSSSSMPPPNPMTVDLRDKRAQLKAKIDAIKEKHPGCY